MNYMRSTLETQSPRLYYISMHKVDQGQILLMAILRPACKITVINMSRI